MSPQPGSFKHRAESQMPFCGCGQPQEEAHAQDPAYAQVWNASHRLWGTVLGRWTIGPSSHMPPEHSRGWPRPANLVCPSFHHCGSSQSLLDVQFSPWALSHQSVCLCCVCLPLSSCLSASCPHTEHHPAPHRCGSHLGCLGRVSSLGKSDRACWSGAEKKSTLLLHPL